MSETNNKLEIKNLSKRFGEKVLFENLSLTVDGPAVLWAPSGWEIGRASCRERV